MVSPDKLNWETAEEFAQHYRGRRMVSPDMLNWGTAVVFAQLYRGRGTISPDMLNWEMVPHRKTEELWSSGSYPYYVPTYVS